MRTVAIQLEVIVCLVISLCDWLNHLSPHTPTAPAGDPTRSRSQSAREADGEGDAENEEERSEAGFGRRRHSRRFPHTGRREARSHRNRSARAESAKEKQTQSFQKAKDADDTQVARWTG